jgi:5-hydroxyisourate hydrolase-like protein (transthyretin family)
MAINNNGNLLDTAGEVAIDFVWGNFPIQPNDARPDTAAGRLDPALDNHIIALSGWNGFPQYSPNTAGEDVLGATDYVLVPNVLNFTTALAQDAMKDASLVVTTASGATNNTVAVTAIARTSGSTTITFTSTNTFTAGEKVRVAATGEAALDADYTVVFSNGAMFTAAGTATTTVSLSGLSATAKRVPGTIKQQSLAAGQNNVAPGAAVTITPWA